MQIIIGILWKYYEFALMCLSFGKNTDTVVDI